jgi:hypothetical protein
VKIPTAATICRAPEKKKERGFSSKEACRYELNGYKFGEGWEEELQADA